MKITFIGAGNMSSALVNGIVMQGAVKASDITVTDLDDNKLSALSKIGVNTTKSNQDAIKNADVVVLAVKPNIYPIVLKEIKEMGNCEDKVFITIAAGVSIKSVKEQLGFDAKVIRTMPNTPAMVGEGMTIICYEEPVTKDELADGAELFKAVGKTEIMNENMLDPVVALTSSSPAYVFMFIEAMADGAVYDGIPRDTAYKMAAQAVMGAAKMVLETGEHPAKLKDMVCSPSGTTIRAVQVLEEEGLRSCVMKAMIECTKKAKGEI